MLDHRRAIPLLVLVGALAAPAARADAPAGRYVLGNDHDTNGDPDIATVTDTKTKLTWQQGFTGPISTAPPFYPQSLCSGLSFDTGVVGWRLPTIKELFTLMDMEVDNGPFGRIDLHSFPNTPGAGFLGSTQSAKNPLQCAYFSGNFILGCGQDVYVRCVR